MRAPRRFLEQTFEDGTVLKFRITVGTMRKLEESVGQKWQDIMSNMGEDPVQSFIDIAWASMLPFNPASTKEDAVEVYDMLVDEGFDQMDMNKFIMKILQVSGLFPKDKDVDQYMDEVIADAEGAEDPK